MKKIQQMTLFKEERLVLKSVLRALGPCKHLAGSALLSVLFIALVGGSVAYSSGGKQVKSRSSGGIQKGFVLDPGKIKFSLYPEGTWKRFDPVWAKGGSLIKGGGLLFLAGKKSGKPGKSILHDILGEQGIGDVLFRGKYFEGIKGGRREPAKGADDDGDGLVDEDRPDGKDNDGDGLVDEDFAAISDEMTVVEFVSDTAASTYQLLVREECYAWSLSHMSAMVMMSVRVRNTGERTLLSPRLGTYWEIPGPAFVVERTIASSLDESVKGTLIACRSGRGILGVLFLVPKEDSLVWGWGRERERIPAALESIRGKGGELLGSKELIRDAKEVKVGTEKGAMLFSVILKGDSLPPGGEAEIELALIGAQTQQDLENATIDAYKTFLGDGKHRLIPPPAAVERKVLWGTYRQLYSPEERIKVTIERARSRGFSLDSVILLNNMLLSKIENKESSGEDVSFIYNGKLPEQALDATGRLSLKGKLKDGSIFEILLRPEEANYKTLHNTSGFWNSPGKLPESLLWSSPNPFRGSATIYFEVPSEVQDDEGNQISTEGALRTQVKIYSVDGRLVAMLVDDVLGPGAYTAKWSAADEYGTPVASGIYYVKLQLESRHITKRLTFLK